MDIIVPEGWPVLLAIGGVGLVLLVIGYIKGSRRRALSRAEVTTQGHVVKLVEDRDHEGGRTSVSYDPQVEFTSLDGATHRFVGYGAPIRWVPVKEIIAALRGSSTDTTGAYGIGKTVHVVYDPENPSNARIPSVGNSVDRWLGIVLMWLFGLGLMAFAIMCFFLCQSSDK